MLSLALAFHTNNQSAADALRDDLSPPVAVQTYSTSSDEAAPLLMGMVDATKTNVVLLISDSYLKSIATVYGAAAFLRSRQNVMPVFVPERRYNAEQGQNVESLVDVSNAEVREGYVKYWRGELERIGAEAGQPGFGSARQTELERVASITHSIEGLLDQLADSLRITQAGLERNEYYLLFESFGAEADWPVYKERRMHHLSSIPGLGMLAERAAGADAGAEGSGREQGAGPGTMKADELGVEDATLAIPPVEPGGENISAELAVEADAQAEIWISRAWELYEKGESEAGLELLATGKESLPDHPDIAYNYALMIAMDTQVPQAALLELEKLLEEFHDHAGALFLSGELSLALGNYESAYLDWLQLSDVDPLYPELNYRLGVLIDDHFPTRRAEALTYLRRASRDEPVNGDARYRYAMLLNHHMGSVKKAIKWLKRAIDASPDHAPAHYALAMLYHKKGKLTAARNHFGTAVHLDPDFDTSRNRAAFAKQPRSSDQKEGGEENTVQILRARVRELEAQLDAHNTAPTSPNAAPATAPEMNSANGKIVLISGATSGIGRATTYALAAAGYRLILLGRRTDRLETIRKELKERHGTTSLTISADIRNRDNLRATLDKLPGDWQNIDVLINNAGKAKGFDPIHEGQYDHWDEMIDVNLKGLLTLTREVSPGMVERGRGTIINVCSTAGKEVYPNGNVYCATKHAVDALTYAMRLDLVQHGIRVGQICPAHVEETEFAVVRFDGDRERAKIYEDFQPLRSQDVAESIHFMLAQPPHVNIMDVVLQGTQQASSTVVDRSGRDKYVLNTDTHE